MTGTAAYSDAIFGLFWLLGYQFSPRLADIGGVRLWRTGRNADYGELDQIARGTVNVSLIRDNRPDLIRLAGSLKLGHLKTASVMRMLQVKDRPASPAPWRNSDESLKPFTSCAILMIPPFATAS